jgi:subtilisin family serine protease
MNRQNFLPHIALAAVVILIAAFAGQIRRWESERKNNPPPRRSTTLVKKETTTSETRRTYYEDNDIIVKFKAGTSIDTIKNIAFRNNDRVKDEIENVSGLAVIDDQDGLDVQSVLNEYRSMPQVEYAEPDFQISVDPNEDYDSVSYSDANDESGITPSKKPNDPMFANQWGLNNTGQEGGKEKADIGALKAWAKTTGSRKVIVAVLDTGVDYTHEDLASNIWHPSENNLERYYDDELGTVDDENGFDATGEDNPMDDNGHGTHCAGVIGADGDNNVGIAGVNWKVEIMPLKFMNKRGNGSTSAAIQAINYVIARKKQGVNVRIISASWGSTQYSKALEDAIREAGKEGIIFIAASGNSSEDTDKRPHYPAGYKLSNVVSVAALDRNDRLAPFSNYGAKTVHVAAPGAAIVSTWLENGFRDASGTSMATPHVAGIAALVLSKESNITVAKLKERLIGAVDPLPELKAKCISGGRINAAKAVGSWQ